MLTLTSENLHQFVMTLVELMDEYWHQFAPEQMRTNIELPVETWSSDTYR